MSDTWNQAIFERFIAHGEPSLTDLLTDDLVNFLDDNALLPPIVDLDSHSPPLPALPSTAMNDDSFDFMGNDTLFDGIGELHGLDPVELQGPDVGNQSHGQAEEVEEDILPSPETLCARDHRNSAMTRAKTLHGCSEINCVAKYQRKSDLARHKREKHGNEEYLCPVSRCEYHRKGHGFQREYRLVNHLWKPRGSLSYYHPQLRKRTDAKFVASHYNNCVLATDRLILNGSPGESGDYSAVAPRLVSQDVRDMGDMLTHYSEQLLTAKCPYQSCSKRSVLMADEGLPRFWLHLMHDHGLGWQVAHQFGRSWRQVLQDELNSPKEGAIPGS